MNLYWRLLISYSNSDNHKNKFAFNLLFSLKCLFIFFQSQNLNETKWNGIESNELKETKKVIKMCTLSSEKEILFTDNHLKQKGKL